MIVAAAHLRESDTLYGTAEFVQGILSAGGALPPGARVCCAYGEVNEDREVTFDVRPDSPDLTGRGFPPTQVRGGGQYLHREAHVPAGLLLSIAPRPTG